MSTSKIIFFGTPDFAIPSLKALSGKGGKAIFYDIKAVITQLDKTVGRHHSTPVPSPIKQAAKGLKLPILEGLERLKDMVEADLGIVVAYGEILPQWVLDKFPLGVLNIHPSLLPKYRGSSPIQAAILNRDKETGVTLMKLDDKMDHGPIVAQEVVPLRPADSAGALHDQLAELGGQMLIKYLPDYIAGKIKLQPQDDSQATYTKKLTKADGQIDWSKSPEQIEAHVRAMNPWPGAWTMWQGKRLIIWRVSLSRHSERSEESQRLITRSFAGAQDDGLILEKVQLEGKTKMVFAEFTKGHPDFKLSDFLRHAKA